MNLWASADNPYKDNQKRRLLKSDRGSEAPDRSAEPAAVGGCIRHSHIIPVGYLDPSHEGSVERFAVRGQDAVQLREQGHHIHVETNSLRRG